MYICVYMYIYICTYIYMYTSRCKGCIAQEEEVDANAKANAKAKASQEQIWRELFAQQIFACKIQRKYKGLAARKVLANGLLRILAAFLAGPAARLHQSCGLIVQFLELLILNVFQQH